MTPDNEKPACTIIILISRPRKEYEWIFSKYYLPDLLIDLLAKNSLQKMAGRNGFIYIWIWIWIMKSCS